MDHKGRSHQAHLAQTFGGWCRFGSAPTQAQISHDVGYCRINLKTVSCYNKATKTFYQDAMSYVRLNLIQDLATYSKLLVIWLQQQIVLNHIIPRINSSLTMANSFRTGHLLSLHSSFWLPGQPGPHKKIKPRPDLVQLLCPPSQNKSFENGRRPKNSRPRCLQQFALITILFSLSTKPKQSLYLYEHFMDDNISYFLTRTCSFSLY